MKYEYICDKCSAEYIEHRSVNMPQHFTVCQKCHLGEYIPK